MKIGDTVRLEVRVEMVKGDDITVSWVDGANERREAVFRREQLLTVPPVMPKIKKFTDGFGP